MTIFTLETMVKDKFEGNRIKTLGWAKPGTERHGRMVGKLIEGAWLDTNEEGDRVIKLFFEDCTVGAVFDNESVSFEE